MRRNGGRRRRIRCGAEEVAVGRWSGIGALFVGVSEGCGVDLCAFLSLGWTVEDDWVACCCYGRAELGADFRTAGQGPSIW